MYERGVAQNLGAKCWQRYVVSRSLTIDDKLKNNLSVLKRINEYVQEMHQATGNVLLPLPCLRSVPAPLHAMAIRPPHLKLFFHNSCSSVYTFFLLLFDVLLHQMICRKRPLELCS